jgi:hypothetical protein
VVNGIEKSSDVEIEHQFTRCVIGAFSRAAKAECGLRSGRKPWLKSRPRWRSVHEPALLRGVYF